jgi:hypothetical protein
MKRHKIYRNKHGRPDAADVLMFYFDNRYEQCPLSIKSVCPTFTGEEGNAVIPYFMDDNDFEALAQWIYDAWHERSKKLISERKFNTN